MDRVVLSTEDAEIAEVAQGLGCEVVGRPMSAATDEAPLEAALLSVDDFMERSGYVYEWLVTLQPTVPIRPVGQIEKCMDLAKYMGAGAVFTALKIPRCWLWEELTGAEFMDHTVWKRIGNVKQRQLASARDSYWMHDGSVCVTHRDILRSTHNRMGGRAYPVTVDERAIDIDTEADLRIADALLTIRAEKEELDNLRRLESRRGELERSLAALEAKIKARELAYLVESK